VESLKFRWNLDRATLAESIGKDLLELDSLQSYTKNNMQIAQENMMLKQMNKDAFTRINSLEARINELMRENEVLMRRISDKQEKEEILQSAFSKFFQSSQPAKTNGQAPSNPMMEGPEKAKIILTEGGVYPAMYDKQHLGCAPGNSGIIICSALTRETSSQSEVPSCVDSYLSFNHEAHLVESSTFNNTQISQASLQPSDLAFPAGPYQNDESSSAFGKRKMQTFKNVAPYEDTFLPYEEPNKMGCFNTFEEGEEPKLNLMDFNAPVFVGGKPDERC